MCRNREGASAPFGMRAGGSGRTDEASHIEDSNDSMRQPGGRSAVSERSHNYVTCLGMVRSGPYGRPVRAPRMAARQASTTPGALV